MSSWSDIVGGDVSFSEKLNETWSRWSGNSDEEDSSNSTDSESEPELEPETEPADEGDWWYGDAPALEWPKPEPIRMTSMQSEDESETIEIRVFHDGYPKAAEVVAVYAEFLLRDAWGDRYHIDVQVEQSTQTGIETTDDWFSWVENNPGKTAKDSNIMVFGDAGYNIIGGGNKAISQRGNEIAKLHGETLFVNGSTQGHDSANTAMHEMLHCLGFDHGDGGRIGSAITPMGHYANTGDTYSFRVHENVKESEPDVQ
jgi:hypothetical protein